jgi:hypothetical protein
MSYSLEKLNKAFYKVKESTGKVVDELDRDGAIQRFEFTFELLTMYNTKFKICRKINRGEEI